MYREVKKTSDLFLFIEKNILYTIITVGLIVYDSFSEGTLSMHMPSFESFESTSFDNAFQLNLGNTYRNENRKEKAILQKSVSSIGMGTLVGFGGMFVGGVVANLAFTDHDDFGRAIGIALGMAAGGCLGYTLGNPLGVYLVSKKYDRKPNYWFSLLGSSLSLGTGVLIAIRHDDIALPITLVTIPIGSVAFNQFYQKIKNDN